MADLREAFKNALEKNPQSKLANDITRSIERASREVDHKGRIERLKRQVNKVGYHWFILRVDSFSGRADQQNVTMDKITDEWKTLEPQMQASSLEEKIDILNSLASGMNLNRERLHRTYQDMIDAQNFLMTYQGMYKNSVPLTPDYVKFRVFGQAIQDICTSSDYKKLSSFRTSVAGFLQMHAKPTLPEFIPTVAQWMESH